MTRPHAIGVAAIAGAAALAVACGGGSDGPSGGMMRDDDDVMLADVQAQVFSPRCALSGCHIGPAAPFGLDLSAGLAAGNIVDVPSAEIPGLMRVEPDDPTDSYLYMKVSGDMRILGDQMPASGPLLSAADLELVRTWIDQGAM